MEDIRELDIYVGLFKTGQVIEDEEHRLIFVWSRAHTVNIYNFAGKEVDCMNVGDFGKNSVLVSEFEGAVYRYLDNLGSEGGD